MLRVAVAVEPPIVPAGVAEDFARAGFEVGICEAATDQLFQAVLRDPPELMVAITGSPSQMLLDSAALLKKVAPCPYILFTNDADPVKIEAATGSGVHSYVVDGYAPGRLRTLAQVAMARFRHERALDDRLDGLSRDLHDRRQVERAKGLLMRSRGLGEAAAFELMRGLAMHSRMRLPNVAESVISLSLGAEAVNRAGQLRMLTQRVVRCLVQLAYGIHGEWAAANLRDCQERIETGIAMLRRTVADRGCEPDIARIAAAWSALQRAAVHETDLAVIDSLSDALTRDAETLTAGLEASGMVSSLRVVNLAGRQRMLSQRVGKLCLLLALDESADAAVTMARAAALQRDAAAFRDALVELGRMPLRTTGIERWLAATGRRWEEMQPFLHGQGEMPRCVEASEGLLDAAEALTAAYEEATQVLIGGGIERFSPGRAGPAA